MTISKREVWMLTDWKIKPEYLKKLERIEKGKFYSFETKEEFMEFVEEC